MGGYATSLSDCELCCVHYFVVVFLFYYVYHFFFAGHFLIDSIVVSQTFRLKRLLYLQIQWKDFHCFVEQTFTLCFDNYTYQRYCVHVNIIMYTIFFLYTCIDINYLRFIKVAKRSLMVMGAWEFFYPFLLAQPMNLES